MASASFIETNPLNWNRIPSLLPHPISHATCQSRLLFIRNPKNSRPSFTLKCVLSKLPNYTASSNELQPAVSRNRILDAFLNAIEALRQPAVAAVLMGALLMYDPHSALAASGGRMGGSYFSSQSSSSSSRSYSSSSPGPSFSYSAPQSYSSSSPGPSFSYSAPRRYSSTSNDDDHSFSYSAPRRYSSTSIDDDHSFSYSAPQSYSSTSIDPSFSYSAGGGEVNVEPAVESEVVAESSPFLILMGFLFVCGFLSVWNEASAVDKTSVMKLQVGLLGMGRSLQKDLNRIAEVADTSTPEGSSYVLTETALALLRHPDYCISGYSSVDVKSMDEGEERFKQLSIEERSKFDEETLVNVNSIRRQSSTSQRSSEFSNEYMVVTILVAAKGVHKLPSINGSEDLKEALQKLASIPASKTLAVEVLWTPQNENDVLSALELREDYPLLRPLDRIETENERNMDLGEEIEEL
ncbi:unnamed protein product [Rhodiola kirilowii]